MYVFMYQIGPWSGCCVRVGFYGRRRHNKDDYQRGGGILRLDHDPLLGTSRLPQCSATPL